MDRYIIRQKKGDTIRPVVVKRKKIYAKSKSVPATSSRHVLIRKKSRNETDETQDPGPSTSATGSVSELYLNKLEQRFNIANEEPELSADPDLSNVVDRLPIQQQNTINQPIFDARASQSNAVEKNGCFREILKQVGLETKFFQ